MRTIGLTKKGEIVELSTMELVSILMVQDKGTFCYLHFETVPKMKKTNNPYFDRVKKITKGNILLGCDYSKRVQNETENPDFQPEKNNVGEKLTKCVRYNEKLDRYYLDYEWFNEVTPKSEYKFNGDPIEKQMFSDFMNTYTPNKYGVNFQSVTISNIKECHMNGTIYTVNNGVEVEENKEILNEVNP
jgi:hypothetical protein